MKKLLAIMATVGLLASGTLAGAGTLGPILWERDIAAFEAGDRTNPPPRGGIEFIGSSTIARWKTLQQDFPGQPVFNRGFGGSELADSTYFADRIVIPYAP